MASTRPQLLTRLGLSVVLLGLLGLLIAGSTSVLAVSLAVSPEAIEAGDVQLTAPCPARVAGEPCWSCGMTRSFTAMSRGQLAVAWHYNRGGPWLYVGTWLLSLGFAWLWVWVLRHEVLVVARELRTESQGR